jgi:hypothetical protein
MAANNTVRPPLPQSLHLPPQTDQPLEKQLDRLVGASMLILASIVFLYYTIWTLLLVRNSAPPPSPAPQSTDRSVN